MSRPSPTAWASQVNRTGKEEVIASPCNTERLRFEVTILGCGAALPLPGRNPTAQVVNLHEKQFLLDCGGNPIACGMPGCA